MADLTAHVARIIADAPPLTEEQITRLGVLLGDRKVAPARRAGPPEVAPARPSARPEVPFETDVAGDARDAGAPEPSHDVVADPSTRTSPGAGPELAHDVSTAGRARGGRRC